MTFGRAEDSAGLTPSSRLLGPSCPSTCRRRPQLPATQSCPEPPGACARVYLRPHKFLFRKSPPGWGSQRPLPNTALLSVPDFSLSRSEGTSCWKVCPAGDTGTPCHRSLLTQSTSNHAARTLPDGKCSRLWEYVREPNRRKSLWL